MKKWIIVILVAATIGGVWYYVRTYVRYTPVWYQPKFGKVTRDDIKVPISAAGLIEPYQRIEVKSKASGEVTRVLVHEGSFIDLDDPNCVKEREDPSDPNSPMGVVLLRLKEDDEKWRRDSAKAELRRAEALREQAKVTVERTKANIITAEAEVERLTAEIAVSEYDYNYARELFEKDIGSQQQVNTLKGRHKVNIALKKAAKSRLTAAICSWNEAQHNVTLQDAAVTIAEMRLKEAEERLRETTIKRRDRALVTDVRVKKGEMIQSGTASLTGGTVVMYLADVSKKKVITRVDESDYGRVLKISPRGALPEEPGLEEALTASVGDLSENTGEVRLTVDAFPEETFIGKIVRVEPQGRLNQGSAIIQYNVHVEIDPNRAAMLPLGAQAQVEFTVESALNTLRVPSEAVKNYQGERGVWIKVPPEPGSNEQWGKKFIGCRFGITDGEYTQVIEVKGETDLKKGMTVYTKLPVDRDKLE